MDREEADKGRLSSFRECDKLSDVDRERGWEENSGWYEHSQTRLSHIDQDCYYNS